MIRAATRALALGPALFLCGCCCYVPVEAETTVVVVPSRHDGHVGAVVVTKGKQQQLLNTAYASSRSASTGRMRQAALQPKQMEEFKKTFAAAITALTLAGAVAMTSTQAQAQSPLDVGAAIVGGALYAGATAVGAVAAAPYYVGAPYYYGPQPYYWGNCGLVKRYDSYGYWVRTDRVCY
jgi:hypothetical protein